MVGRTAHGWGCMGEESQRASSSGILTGLYCLEFDQVFWLIAVAMVLPHLQIEPLQLYRVLLGVEKRAANSLLPNARSNHLQAAGDRYKVVRVQQTENAMLFKKVRENFHLLFHVRA